MKEIYPDIYSITEKGSYGVFKPPENIYLLAGKDGLIFDAGYGDKKSINYVIDQIHQIKSKYQSEGKSFKITRVLPSHAHPDHFSGLKALKEKLDLQIVTTRKTAEIIKNEENFIESFESDPEQDLLSIRNLKRRIKDRIQRSFYRFMYYRLYGLEFVEEPDEIIKENTMISINGEDWTIFPSPGHSPDHISLYHEEKGILFSGDNILRTITTWLGPPNSNIKDYVDSIKKIQDLPRLEQIFPSHGSPIQDPQQRIDQILHHRNQRKAQVLDIVNNHYNDGISASGVVDALYPGAKKVMQNTARGWVCLTLKELEDQGIIERSVEKKSIKFHPPKN